jgi:hypothetical protein
MKFIYLLLVFLVPLKAFCSDEDLNSSSTLVKDFGGNVKEEKFYGSYSELYIDGYQDRTAAESRKLMCKFVEIASYRDANYFSVLANEKSGNKVILVYPKTKTEKDAAFDAFKKHNYDIYILPVGPLKTGCGIKSI